MMVLVTPGFLSSDVTPNHYVLGGRRPLCRLEVVALAYISIPGTDGDGAGIEPATNFSYSCIMSRRIIIFIMLSPNHKSIIQGLGS